jgi:hypothetical protein
VLVRRTVRSSFAVCGAPLPREVFRFARVFGVGVGTVRSSRRSFSFWVLVCSFPSESAALQFKSACGEQFFGCSLTYFAVRQVGRRWRVSVPVLVPQVVFQASLGRPRLGRFRVVTR